MVVFDTAVVDLTDELHDPVDLLFGTQLGGGTDINRALGYCQQLITRPTQTIFVLITDLYEGGNAERCSPAAARGGERRHRRLPARPQRHGRAHLRRPHAAALAALGVPTFACTPDLFPELMAAALAKRDVGFQWASPRAASSARARPESRKPERDFTPSKGSPLAGLPSSSSGPDRGPAVLPLLEVRYSLYGRPRTGPSRITSSSGAADHGSVRSNANGWR